MSKEERFAARLADVYSVLPANEANELVKRILRSPRDAKEAEVFFKGVKGLLAARLLERL